MIIPFSVSIMNEVVVNIHEQGSVCACAFLLAHTWACSVLSSPVPPGCFMKG